MNIPEHQLEAYKVLYQLENILRVALHKFMTEKFGENYFTEEIFSPFFHSSLNREINVHNRVMFWVDHYMGDTDKARTKAKKLLKNLAKDDFMYDQILHDIEVLSQ